MDVIGTTARNRICHDRNRTKVRWDREVKQRDDKHKRLVDSKEAAANEEETEDARKKSSLK